MAEVDLGVSHRQNFGAGFVPKPGDMDVAERIADGGAIDIAKTRFVPAKADWSSSCNESKAVLTQAHSLVWLEPVRRRALVDAEDDKFARLWKETILRWAREEKPKVAWLAGPLSNRTLCLILGYPLFGEDGNTHALDAIQVDYQTLYKGRLFDGARIKDPVRFLEAALVAGAFFKDDALVRRVTDNAALLLGKELRTDGLAQAGSIFQTEKLVRKWQSLELRLRLEGIESSEFHSRMESAKRSVAAGVRPDGYFEELGDTPRRRRPKRYVPGARRTDSRFRPATFSTFEAGFGFGRSHTDDQDEQVFYSFRYGDHLAPHGHDDGTSFTLFAFGQPWVIDPGMYGTKSDEMRDFIRSRESHNLIHTRNVSTSASASAVLEFGRSDGRIDHSRVVQDVQGLGRVCRDIIFDRELMLFALVDRVHSKSVTSNENPLVQTTTVNRDVEVQIGQASAKLSNGSRVVSVSWTDGTHLSTSRGEKEPIRGWQSGRPGMMSPTNIMSASFAPAHQLPLVTAFSLTGRTINVGACVETDLGIRLNLTLDGQDVHFEFDRRGARILGFKLLSSKSGPSSEWENSPSTRLGAVAPENAGVGALRTASVEGVSRLAREIVLASDDPSNTAWHVFEVLAGRARELYRTEPDYGMGATMADLWSSFSSVSSRAVPLENGTRTGIPAFKDAIVRGRHTDFFPLERVGQIFGIEGKHRKLSRRRSLIDGDGVRRSVGFTRVGGLIVSYNIHKLTENKQGDELVVWFHGQCNRNSNWLPRFGGVTYGARSGRSAVSIEDPTLDLSATLENGFFLGNGGRDGSYLLEQIVEGIAKIASVLRSDRIVLCGNQGGAFAALKSALLLERHACSVVAFNPVVSLQEQWLTSSDTSAASAQDDEAEIFRTNPVSAFSINAEDVANTPLNLWIWDDRNLDPSSQAQIDSFVNHIQMADEPECQLERRKYLGACPGAPSPGHLQAAIDLALDGQ